MPTHERMRQEFVFRSHCREPPDRVAAGLTPVPGTAAEVALAVMHASQKAPLNTAAFGLYIRMWTQFTRTLRSHREVAHRRSGSRDTHPPVRDRPRPAVYRLSGPPPRPTRQRLRVRTTQLGRLNEGRSPYRLLADCSCLPLFLSVSRAGRLLCRPALFSVVEGVCVHDRSDPRTAVRGM